MKDRDAAFFAIGTLFGFGMLVLMLETSDRSPGDIYRQWRRYNCAQRQAALVADTLCVRPDSSWRVEEPK